MDSIFIDISNVDTSLLDTLNIKHYDRIKDENNSKIYVEFGNYVVIELLQKDDIDIYKDDVSVTDKDRNKFTFDFSKWTGRKDIFIFLDEENIKKRHGDTVYLSIRKPCGLHDNVDELTENQLLEDSIDDKTEYNIDELEGISDEKLNSLFRNA